MLWRLRDRPSPPALFALFAALFGLERFPVEFLRISARVLVGLSQPQLWSLALIAAGAALLYRTNRRGAEAMTLRAARPADGE